MAPRSEYILPLEFQSNRVSPADKITKDNIDFTNEENDPNAKSLFKQILPNDKLLDLQIDDGNQQQNVNNQRSCYNSKVERNLLPELEFEATRLGLSGPWFTIPRSQHRRSMSQRKKLNDPVKQKLFMN